MSRGFVFNGEQYISPGVFSAVDESAMADTSVSLTDNLAILADTTHGVPGEVTVFSDASQAAKVLVDGEALAAIRKAFSPSAETGGAATVSFVRVGVPTQSTAVLADSSSNSAINLTSTDYGAQTVGLQFKLIAGTSKGVQAIIKSNGTQYIGDNIYSAPLTLTYSGSGQTPLAQVNVADITLRVGGAIVKVLPFTNYATVQSLADAISVVTGFAATVGTGAAGLAATNLFDVISSIAVITGGTDLTAINVALVNWINNGPNPVISAAAVAGAGAAAVTSTWTVLQGGTSPAVTNTDWGNAFDLLQAEDIQWVVPISSAPSVLAMLSAHVDFCSTIGRSWRRAWGGLALGTTDVAAVAEALALNDDRVSLVHLGVYDFDSAGVLTLYAPYVLAAQCAGALAGAAPGTALTNKTLKCQGFERKLKNPTDTDKLIEGGVVPFHQTKKGYFCTMSISTWMANDNINRVQVNTGVALDYTCRAVREALEDEPGKNGSALLLNEIVSRVDTTLAQLAKPLPTGMGLLVGDDTNPAYKNITASLVDDHIVVEFQCSPVVATNYIAAVVHAVPYSGTASA